MALVNEKFGIPRTSVTAAMIQNQRFMEKEVRLIGNVVKSTGDAIEVDTGDSTNVRVRFSSPLDEPLEGLVDIYGRVVGKNTVEADSYIIVPLELAENFDLPTYNRAVTFIGSSENPWTKDSSF